MIFSRTCKSTVSESDFSKLDPHKIECFFPLSLWYTIFLCGQACNFLKFVTATTTALYSILQLQLFSCKSICGTNFEKSFPNQNSCCQPQSTPSHFCNRHSASCSRASWRTPIRAQSSCCQATWPIFCSLQFHRFFYLFISEGLLLY